MPSAAPPAPARPPALPLFPLRPLAPARPLSPRPLLAGGGRIAPLPVSLLLVRSVDVDVDVVSLLLLVDAMGIAGCSRNPPPRLAMPLPPPLPPRCGFVFDAVAVAEDAADGFLVLLGVDLDVDVDISMSFCSLSPSHPHSSASASPESAVFAVSTLNRPDHQLCAATRGKARKDSKGAVKHGWRYSQPCRPGGKEDGRTRTQGLAGATPRHKVVTCT